MRRPFSTAASRAKKAAINAPVDPNQWYIDNQLETAADRGLALFLEPFVMSALPDTVHKLTGAGYLTVASLRSLDAAACAEIEIGAGDAEKLLLAVWLQSNGDAFDKRFGASLVASGCDSLLKLLTLSDAALQRAGVVALGHRRQLQRYLREDEVLQERAARIEEDARAARTKGLYGSSGSAKLAAKDDAFAGSTGSFIKRSGSSSAAAPQRQTIVQQQEAEQQQRDELQVERLNFLGEVVAEDAAGRPHQSELMGALPPSRLDAWCTPWVTTFNAALSGGAGPGERGEAHVGVQTPRDGLCLVRNDGSRLRVW